MLPICPTQMLMFSEIFNFMSVAFSENIFLYNKEIINS